MLQLELTVPESPRVEATWRLLEARAQPPYFLTWGWIENWLACLAPGDRPELATFRSDDGPVAACFLARRRVRRRHLLPTRTMFVNATGIPHIDDLCLEHNALLGAPDARVSLTEVLRLLPGGWDELQIAALDRDAMDLEAGPHHLVHVEREVAAPYVELAAVRARGDYAALLGSNTRAQLRRSRRRLGERGDLRLEVARDAEHARAIYDELVALHTARWRERGQPGAFADPWVDGFHRRLIAQRFAHGEIQLLRLRAGARTVGCAYNLISSGRVLFYQSGLARFDDAAIKPGYALHAAAIEHAAHAGHAVYDLLAGDTRYKRALATDAAPLLWVRIQRKLIRFAVEEQLREWKRELAARGLVARRRHAP
jgi:CelD/BcsL family acetyltransferase involved in cellulose biosynthesis